MFEVRIIPNDPKRKKCKCKERCAVLVQYVDVDGDIVRTACGGQAKDHAIDVLSKLITSSSNVFAGQKTLKSLRSWQHDEKPLTELYNEGYSYGMIALKLGRTYGSTKKKIMAMRSLGKLNPRLPQSKPDML